MSDIDRLIEKSKLHGESGILVTPSMAESLKRERDSANARAEAAEKKVADLKQELANTQMAAGNQIDWKPNATLATAHGLSKIDYMDLLEKCADTTINRLAQENINLTEQLQSANARAEAAEEDAAHQHKLRVKENESFVRIYLENQNLNAQIEQLQTVVQEYEVDLAARDLEIEQLQEQLENIVLWFEQDCEDGPFCEGDGDGYALTMSSEQYKQLRGLVDRQPIPPTDLVPGGVS